MMMTYLITNFVVTTTTKTAGIIDLFLTLYFTYLFVCHTNLVYLILIDFDLVVEWVDGGGLGPRVGRVQLVLQDAVQKLLFAFVLQETVHKLLFAFVLQDTVHTLLFAFVQQDTLHTLLYVFVQQDTVHKLLFDLVL